MNSWLKRLLEHVKACFLVLMGVSDSEMLPAHMEEPPITSSLGPTDRLIRRLRSLEGSSFKQAMLAGIDVDQIKGLREHFQEFCNPMSNLSKMDDSSFKAKWWMKEVRELCYDTEDYLEEVIMHSSVRGLRRIAGITINLIYSKLKWRPQLSQFIARAEVLKEISQNSLQEEIKAADISLNKGNNGDISFEKENKANIERLATNLIKLLAFDDDNKTQLKVVPISGSAGAGKTVLATTLYVMYKRKFQCRAFVRVSRNPDIRSLLRSILSQIKAPPPHGFPDVMDLIVSISTHLKGKRYFIIIDDVWRTSVWDIIRRAFPDGNCCSRIIITTESERVASACSESTICKRGALDGDQSGKFSREVSGSKGDCTNTTSRHTNMVLNLRYNNLPLHLKTCLLFLSIYPEGCLIMKDDMAKQWVAEGFIAAVKRHGSEEISGVPEDKKEEHSEVPQDKTEELSEVPQDNPEKIADAPQKKTEKISEVRQKETEEIARGYFDELVTRGMIQPVDRNHKGEVLSCTVHHMVLDLIRNESKEDNFIIVVDNLQSTLGHPDIVRRLSVQFGCEKGASMPESITLSQVRSLAYYGLLGCVPSITEYGLLRVLILHICADEDKIFDLSGIGELYHLRYLKIECNVTVRLPAMIRRLQHLGTLELHAEVVAIPSDIGHLQKLIHVLCPSKANLFDLGELQNLLDLQLTWFTLENLEENMNCLRSILEKLKNLRCLSLVPTSGSYNVNTLQDEAGVSRMSISCDSLCMVSPAPSHLQRLELSRRGCIFSRLPKWLGELAELQILKIAVRVLYTNDIDILKGLPALTDLSLDVYTMSAETVVIGKEKLSVLTYFKFTCTVPILNFENGAMLNLELLKLCSNAPIVDEKGITPIIAELTEDRMAAADTNAYDVGTILATGERDYLIRNSGEQVKISSIEGATVALYFSASWCPPCRRFMPKLIEAYKELDSPAKRLEVVMVSSDRDEEAFSTYFAKMPWLAVPFSDSEGRKGLDERFEVTRVPHLVILDAKTGEVLTEEGVEFVSAYGIESYPFTPERINELKEQEKAAKDNQTIHSLVGTPNRDYLISKKGDKVPIADLEGKYVGMCFVVNGYGPVEEFTRVLAKIYGELKKVGEKFEVVAVSIDSDEASFSESFSNMPWLAIPPGDKTCEKLVRYFELSDLPTLVLIGSDGKTLNRNIAEIVSEHGLESCKGFPFNAEKLEILAEKAKAKAESQTLDSLLVIGDLDFVIRKDGAKVPVAELVGKTVLLYFSAQWCGPARAFQTVLVDVYTKRKEKNCDFEIVFISSDRDTSSFNGFFSGMPWLALPLKDERKANLKRMFKIRGIPSVVAIGPDGKTVNTDAKTSLVVHGADAFPFTDERLQELEKKMDEMAKGWPKKLRHDLHEHELVLTRRPRPFGCDGCDGMGGSWSYRCEACDFDLHTSCALREENKGDEERLQDVEKRNDEMAKGCPPAQTKKGRPQKHMHEHDLTGKHICNRSDEKTGTTKLCHLIFSWISTLVGEQI